MRRQAPRPSITWFTDCATNAITGVAVTPGHPSRKSVLAALRSADLRDGPHRRCGARFVMVRSNWQLNAAKFEAIGAFEQRLPAYAHSKAEWAALGEDATCRRPTSSSGCRSIFTVAHVVAFCALVV